MTVNVSVSPTLIFPVNPPFHPSHEEYWHLEGVRSPPFASNIMLVKSH